MIILRLFRYGVQCALVLFVIIGVVGIIDYMKDLPSIVTSSNMWLVVLFTIISVLLFIFIWRRDWDYPTEYYDNWYDKRQNK